MASRSEDTASFRAQMTILTPITSRFYALRNYAGSFAWGPLVQLSRSACLSLLCKIKIGQLEILDCDGARVTCGREVAVRHEPQATIRIHKETFWVRLLLFADMVCTLCSFWSAVSLCYPPGFRRSISSFRSVLCRSNILLQALHLESICHLQRYHHHGQSLELCRKLAENNEHAYKLSTKHCSAL